MNFYTKSKDEIIHEFQIGTEGLDDIQVENMRIKYGSNELQEKQRKTPFIVFLLQFNDFLIWILLVAAVLSGILGKLESTLVIAIVVLINAILGTVQHLKAEESLSALKALSAPKSKVIRNGETVTVDSKDVVVGDLMIVESGDFISADGRIIDSFSLRADESSLTGESVSVEKDTLLIDETDLSPGDQHNMIFSGTHITYGRGRAIVTGVGRGTEIGKIATLIEEATEKETPLQKSLDEFGKKLAMIIIAIAVLVFALNLYRNNPLVDAMMFSISLAVAAIPEALSSIITIVLAVGTRRMAQENAIVRKLHAVEGLGSVSVICSDKTGTLTQGAFTVSQIESRLPGREKELLEIAALAESFSTHPIARSVQQAWEKDGGSAPDKNRIKDYRDQAGRGVYAVIDGRRVLLGNIRLLAEAGVGRPAGAEANQAGTWLYMAIDGQYAGAICLEDQLKPEAAAALSELKSLGIERHLLLSGDRTANVAGAAAAAGIAAYKAELLPEQKVEAIEALMEKSTAKQRVAYIGDGINDAPVLARVDLGIALGGGSDAALERADVVMISADLKKIPAAIRLARRTNRIVRQNIVLALGIKSVILILAVFGLGGIWQAVFADVGVALLAVLNSLRVLRPGMRNRLS